MTVMLLALVFSDAALNASEVGKYKIGSEMDGGGAETRAQPSNRTRAWSPGVDSWKTESGDCPVFFQRDIDGFGTFRVGARCREDDGLPHAL